jgi:metal-dependent amidase/aminoacylase/carboxypeptidase family protein
MKLRLGFPALINHTDETEFARAVAIGALGPAIVEAGFRPRTASEDFAFMLMAHESYLFLGNGDSPSAQCSNTTSTTRPSRRQPTIGCA